MTYDPKVIEALAELRTLVSRVKYEGLTFTQLARFGETFNTLDNAGVFAALDEQTDYAAAEDILAESAALSLGAPLDAAEWGDTARRQGLLIEPKNTPLDEPLVGRQAAVYGRLLRQAGCKSCGLRVADGSEYHASCRPMN